ncbi:MAG: hypothetical protein Q9187_003406 [Circinaria calcarea]
MSNADAEFKPPEFVDDTVDAPSGADTKENTYVSQPGQDPIPVQKDEESAGDPIDPATADSDETLERDDAEAIDKSNIVKGRTRGAKPVGEYTEPGDEEGLPENDGRSAVAQGIA